MGLDQYAYRTKLVPQTASTLVIDDENEEAWKSCTRFAQWRKHANLQGWMQALYKEKGGTEEFNCVNLPLTTADINRLEHAVLSEELPETRGFFFGASTPEDKEDDIKFILDAREALAEGDTVFYRSWW